MILVLYGQYESWYAQSYSKKDVKRQAGREISIEKEETKKHDEQYPFSRPGHCSSCFLVPSFSTPSGDGGDAMPCLETTAQ